MVDILSLIKKLLFQEGEACPLCQKNYGSTYFAPTDNLNLCPNCRSQIHFLEEPICLKCGRSIDANARISTCRDCSKRSDFYFRMNRSAVTYSPLMKEWIYTYKYRGRESLSNGLAELMHYAYLKYYRNLSFQGITFVPLHPERLRERKFNQAEQLAYRLSKKINLPLLSTLERIIDTPKQSHKNRKERMESLKGAFRYVGEVAPTGPIILVDDIYTTGSTLNECSKVLQINGWKNIYTLTIVRA